MFKKRRLTKVLSLVVSITGIAVMAGWVFDINILKSISPAWVSMKFDTALAFFLSGITIYFIVRAQEGAFDKAQVVLSIVSLTILLIMGILFFSTLFGIRTGTEELFVIEAPGQVKTVTPGLPSLPTMFNFILIACAGILAILKPLKLLFKLKVLGLIIGIIGALAVTGYIINAPLLYYYISGINSATACHTAILFVLIGIGLVCL